MAATTRRLLIAGLMLTGLLAWQTRATADQAATDAGQGGQDPFAEGGEDPFAGEGENPFGGEGGDPFADPGAKSRGARPSERPTEHSRAGHEGGPSDGHEGHPEQAEQTPNNPPLQTVFWAGGGDLARERIDQTLNRPLRPGGLDFNDAPLEEVVDFLRTEYEIEIQLDETALDDLGIGIDEPITCVIRNISLMSGMRLMLKQLELTYVIADEVMLITTEEEAETRLTIGIYPMRGVAKDKRELMELAKVVVSTVAAETWKHNGGGEANLQSLDAGFLVVSQTRAVHEELIEFLSALRRAKAAGSGMNGARREH
ncbi:hypothetical protein Pla123a_37780 [Posidoniimonas polymericola]|uniref:Bacterial type II/III secretion system short domain protein n=1 Tax=Posidoniimonas polymericola TaxID=2528002 RepID=A0A5C5YF66_9BACT|nr:hypothetical protein [Posidoniimonas polymericola]TWT73443.1 hypothetical protein Pla123a_37780 [Posidoniimonas polymericola]